MFTIQIKGYLCNQILLSLVPVVLTITVRAPRAKYTIVGEAIRHVIPGHMQCSIGCGGQACKYDNPSYWSEDQQAIKGLYSSWYSTPACST